MRVGVVDFTNTGNKRVSLALDVSQAPSSPSEGED
jgi:hypothetical protein